MRDRPTIKQRKDEALTLGVEEEFQIVAVGFGLSKFRKAKKPSRVKSFDRAEGRLAKKKGVTDENNSFVT